MVASMLLVGCAMWAFAPAGQLSTPINIELRAPATGGPTEVAPTQSIDPSVFAVRLWNPPPAPQEQVVVRAEPPKPLNLQLIGIIQEGAQHRAAVYDVDKDQLLIVASGDRIREQTVMAITLQSVELSDGNSTRRLTLKQEPS
jgi:hypothetical protein